MSYQKLLDFITQIATDPHDSGETRFQKVLLVAVTPLLIFIGLLWGGMYIAFGETPAALIPIIYSVITFALFGVFYWTRNYPLFRFSQHFFLLLLPFILMIFLGGFINSSAVIIWSLLSPMSALVFSTPREAVRWLLAYIGLVIVSGFLQPYVRTDNNLSQTLVTILFVMNIASVSTVAFIFLYYFTTQKNTTLGLLKIEQAKSENLLLNILPKDIAAILKQENRTIADHFDNVSILFADVVNFTPLSAQLSPVQVVDLLNRVFSHFDILVEKYDLEKIKTIGDCYMVAAGIPRPRSDHAHILAEMALEMRDHPFEINGQRLNFRIGINSGPVVAGVIGRKKFIYDLWGDAVNTASRMESHGSAGRIQITYATYELIKDDFICEPLGVIQVKGKGEMEVWQLVGRKA